MRPNRPNRPNRSNCHNRGNRRRLPSRALSTAGFRDCLVDFTGELLRGHVAVDAMDFGAIRPDEYDCRKAVDVVPSGKVRAVALLGIELAPLRERREDILPMAEGFLQKFGEMNGKSFEAFSADALIALESYSWPGNVRELENAVERAAVLALSGTTVITLDLLPNSMRKAA